jgi:hypothetical protein
MDSMCPFLSSAPLMFADGSNSQYVLANARSKCRRSKSKTMDLSQRSIAISIYVEVFENAGGQLHVASRSM